MSLPESRGALSDAMKELFARWNDVQSVWHDSQSRDFEKNVLDPLRPAVQSALKALEQLNFTIHTIRSDCQ